MANWNNLNIGAQGAISQGAIQNLTRTINGGLLNSNITSKNQILNLNGSAINWSDNPFSVSNQHARKYEVFETEEDILALSVAWQRMRKERDSNNSGTPSTVHVMPSSLLDRYLFDSVKQEDKDRAAMIRDYYSKKLMMWALNEVKLTNFREDMKKLIQSEGKVFKENMLPLAYRMPEFYDYDTQVDELMLAHNTSVKQEKHKQITSKRLRHVKTLNLNRRHSKLIEYWFKDDNDNLNYIKINRDNPLKALMDYTVKSTITVDGLYSKITRDNREFCVVEKYSFL